jgi:hypothetical protein
MGGAYSHVTLPLALQVIPIKLEQSGSGEHDTVPAVAL